MSKSLAEHASSQTLRRSPAWLLLLLSMSGCSTFQSAINGISHWQENRVDCPPVSGTHGNNDCVQPCVALEPTEGYLSQGPTFGGEQVLGNPAPNAIDRMLELTREVDELRAAKADLEQQLSVAEETIRQQGTSIDAATKELQRALADYNSLHDRLASWQKEFGDLAERAETRDRDREAVLAQFETDLQEILSQCEARAAGAQETSTHPETPADSHHSTDTEKTEVLPDPDIKLPPHDSEATLEQPEAPIVDAHPPVEGQTPIVWISDNPAKGDDKELLAPVVNEREEGVVTLIPPSNRRPDNRAAE